MSTDRPEGTGRGPVDQGAERERELALLEDAAQVLAAAPRADDVYPVIVRLAALIGATPTRRWRASYLALQDGVLRRIALHDDAGIELGAGEYPLRDYPVLRRVLEGGDPVFTTVSEDVAMPAETAAAVRDAQLGAAVMLPVSHGDDVYGMLALSTRDPLPAEEVRYQRLRAVAHLAGMAIANARLLAEQQDLAARARALEIAKSRFLNLAAHEMRGPLTVIRGYADMLGDGSLGPLTGQAAAAVDTLRRKADEMSRLVTLMMETARVEGDAELQASEVDLAAVVRDVVGMLAPLIGEAHAVTFEPCDDPVLVSGDADRLSAVVANLVDNASKYSPPGTPITVRCRVVEGSVQVAVTDEGIGLSEDDMGVLFTRFGRVVSAETSHIGGTGLGLWLAREIARMHGGDITVESRRGEGSTFTLSLPVPPATPGSPRR